MKKLNVSNRDIKIFFLGMLLMFLILSIADWKEVKRGISDGYNIAMVEHVK